MRDRRIVFSTHPLHPDVTDALASISDYRVADRPMPEEIDEGSKGADIIVVRAPISADIVRRESKLRAMIRHGAGLDMIPVDVATECGVLVGNVPGANARTVAEHVVWCAISLLRRHPMVNSDLRDGGWEAGRRHADDGREFSNATLGIIGLGNIGCELAGIVKRGFGTEVIAYTRSPDRAPPTVEIVALIDLLSRSDIVVLCCPLTDATHGLIDQAAFQAMKPGAILVNVSRGPIVEENALLDALDTGKLSGAALDVFEQQPLPPDHPILAMSNVILTPHMAGITDESMMRMGQGVLDHVKRLLVDQPPEPLINPAALQRFRERFPN
ncbi:MAG: NAD(P)-dependent oxidoreductase [Boseongicola sp.]